MSRHIAVTFDYRCPFARNAHEAVVKAVREGSDIDFGRADTQRALEKLLAQRAGQHALAQAEKSYASSKGKPPDRVNPVQRRPQPGQEHHAQGQELERPLIAASPLAHVQRLPGDGERVCMRRHSIHG